MAANAVPVGSGAGWLVVNVDRQTRSEDGP
jgi:hypothetical protein